MEHQLRTVAFRMGDNCDCNPQCCQPLKASVCAKFMRKKIFTSEFVYTSLILSYYFALKNKSILRLLYRPLVKLKAGSQLYIFIGFVGLKCECEDGNLILISPNISFNIKIIFFKENFFKIDCKTVFKV